MAKTASLRMLLISRHIRLKINVHLAIVGNGMWHEIPVVDALPNELTQPFILDNAAKVLGWPAEHARLTSLDFFESLASSDTVGLSFGTAYDTEAVYLPLSEALNEVKHCPIGEERYIAGWEYSAGDAGEVLAELGNRVVSWESQCLLTSSSVPGLRQVADLMKWFFIGSSSTSSGVHADPLGAHGWMFLYSGSKRWKIAQPPHGYDSLPVSQDLSPENPRLISWKFSSAVLNPGQLIFVPGGSLHCVENGPGISIAITQNFLSASNLPIFWSEIFRGLSLLSPGDSIEDLVDNPKVDSLLFGAIISIYRASEHLRVNFGLCDSPARVKCLQVFSSR